MARKIIGFILLGLSGCFAILFYLFLSQVKLPEQNRMAWFQSLSRPDNKVLERWRLRKKHLTPFCEKVTGKCGYRNGDKVVVSPIFEQAGAFLANYKALAIQDERLYVVERNGSVKLLDPSIGKAHLLWPGLAAVSKAGKWGIVDNLNNMVLSPQYDEIGSALKEPIQSAGGSQFSALAAYKIAVKIRLGQKWGYIIPISRSYLKLIHPVFSEAEDYRDKPVAVKVDGRYGLLKKNGEWLVRPHLKDKPAFLDMETGGKQTTFDHPMNDNRRTSALIRTVSGLGMIAQSGRFVVDPYFSAITCYHDGFLGAVMVEKDRKWGLVDPFGKPLTKVVFDKIACFKKQACYTVAQKDETAFLLDRYGESWPYEAVLMQEKCQTQRYPYGTLRFIPTSELKLRGVRLSSRLKWKAPRNLPYFSLFSRRY